MHWLVFYVTKVGGLTFWEAREFNDRDQRDEFVATLEKSGREHHVLAKFSALVQYSETQVSHAMHEARLAQATRK
jgi:hypothetical protein